MTCLLLFYEFFKTGLFAVGGGLATSPSSMTWPRATPSGSPSQLADMVAVSESTPGPLGVNMATYVGFITGRHSRCAWRLTMGLVTPSIIIILIVAAFLKRFRDSKLVNAVFYGLRPASTAMVASAGVSVAALALVNTGAVGLALVNWKGVALASVLLVLTRWCKATKGLHPIVFILASAIIGVVFSF